MRKAPLNGSLGRTNYGAVTVSVRNTVPVVTPLPVHDTDAVTFPRDAFATAVNTSDPDECDPVRVSGVAVAGSRPRLNGIGLDCFSSGYSPRYTHPDVHVSCTCTALSCGSAVVSRSQIHFASTSLVGFSSPAMSFR